MRLTSVSLGYKIAQAIAGGVSPAMAMALTLVWESVVGVCYIYTIFAFVPLIGIITMLGQKGGASGADKELDSGVSST